MTELIDLEKLKEDNPLDAFLGRRGFPITAMRSGELLCICPLHEDKKPSFNVNLAKKTWICRAGCGGGDIITLVEKMDGVSRGEAIRKLSLTKNEPCQPPKVLKPDPEKSREVAAYDYRDATGQLKFQVVRYEPKDFRQRKINDDGSISWSMEGVERLLYNLPEVTASNQVIICEGEKDCDNLSKFGLTATCNPGGAKKWLPSYTPYLEGKGIIIIPDNDIPGDEHAKIILKALEGKVKWVKWLKLPSEINGKKIKDISDVLATCKDEKESADILTELVKKARHITKGVDCEVYSIEELETRYIQNADLSNESCLDLKRWLPSLGVRPLVKGDLLGIMGGTGNLKTATAQNILQSNADLSSLIFELELAEELMVERSIAMATRQHGDDIREKIISKSVQWKKTNRLNNLFISLKSNVDMIYVDEMIERSSAKIGKIPDVFCIDYIQLIKGQGSRYERVSDAAEQAKVLAKKWGCVGIILSQIKRKSMEDKKGDKQAMAKIREVTLEDGKESGSLENSCGLVLGVWKDSPDTMQCRVLKNTRGRAGKTVLMEIAPGLHIRERVIV